MRTLTIPQPLAGLAVLGELATLSIPYGTTWSGPLALHAHWRPAGWPGWVSRDLVALADSAGPGALPFLPGAVVGVVWLDSTHADDGACCEPQGLRTGWHWRIGSPRPLASPITTPGRPAQHWLWSWTSGPAAEIEDRYLSGRSSHPL